MWSGGVFDVSLNLFSLSLWSGSLCKSGYIYGLKYFVVFFSVFECCRDGFSCLWVF